METGLDLLKIQGRIFNMKAAADHASQAGRILRRIASKGPGGAFTPHDFADIARVPAWMRPHFRAIADTGEKTGAPEEAVSNIHGHD